MKTNSKFLCGLPSSSKLHNPAIRRMNHMEKKALAILKARKLQKREEDLKAARQAAKDERNKQAEMSKLSTLKNKAIGKVKGFFRRLGS